MHNPSKIPLEMCLPRRISIEIYDQTLRISFNRRVLHSNNAIISLLVFLLTTIITAGNDAIDILNREDMENALLESRM